MKNVKDENMNQDVNNFLDIIQNFIFFKLSIMNLYIFYNHQNKPSVFFPLNGQRGVCLFFFFFLFRAVHASYGCSQTRGQIRAAAYTTATASSDPSCVFDLHHSSQWDP